LGTGQAGGRQGNSPSCAFRVFGDLPPFTDKNRGWARDISSLTGVLLLGYLVRKYQTNDSNKNEFGEYSEIPLQIFDSFAFVLCKDLKKEIGVKMKFSPFKNPKAIIFDFDGTLAVLNIDFHAMREQIFGLINHFGIEEKLIIEKYLLEVVDEAYQILRKRNPFGAEEFYQKAHRIFYGIEMMAAEKGRLIPGTEKTLNSLRERGIKVGIVTRNCEEAVRKVFPKIDDFCDVFISRNSVKKVKPHPDHLTYIMELLKVSGSEVLMVGDHPTDIQAGKQAGMKTIGVLTGRTKREEFEKIGADYILDNAAEICRLLKEP
jgi:phosphoglycolate phosphatase